MTGSDFNAISTFLGLVAGFNARRSRNGIADLATSLPAVATFGAKNAAEPTLPASHFLSSVEISAFLSAIASSPAAAQRPTPVFNIWKVVGLGRNEVRNTSILAWALDPRGSHGKGAAILNSLVTRVRRGKLPEEDLSPFPEEVTQCFVTTEAPAFADQANRVDILMDGPGFTAFVEAKIDAPPNAEQVLLSPAFGATRQVNGLRTVRSDVAHAKSGADPFRSWSPCCIRHLGRCSRVGSFLS